MSWPNPKPQNGRPIRGLGTQPEFRPIQQARVGRPSGHKSVSDPTRRTKRCVRFNPSDEYSNPFNSSGQDTYVQPCPTLGLDARARVQSNPTVILVCMNGMFWAQSVDVLTNFEGSPGSLRRTIERISSFHLHVATLIRFSVSRRMRSYFFINQVNICRVSGSRLSQQSWPSSIADWTKLLNSICDDLDRVFFESQKTKHIKIKILILFILFNH
jgi:hypothetical protein